MAVTTGSPPTAGRRFFPGPGGRPPRRAARAGADFLFWLICQSAAVTIIVVAALLVLLLVWRSWLALRTLGVSFLTQTRWDPVEEHPVFGSLAFVYGTLATAAIAMAIAVPLGVGTAAYLSEIASGWLKRTATFFIEMLAAIPSVVYGFWGIYVLAPLLQDYLFTPLGGPNTGGLGVLAAGLILSIMIVPYIAAISYDVCQAVPRSQREGSLALGATRWQTIHSVVIPYARPGIVGGCFLALGRALGETMAVTMLIGNTPEIQLSLFARGDSIASVIANQYVEASYDLYKSVLVQLGLLLLVVTVVINSLARLLIWRVARPRKVVAPARLAGGAGLALGLVPALLVLLASRLPAGNHPAGTASPEVTRTLAVCLGLALLLLAGHVYRAVKAGFSAANAAAPGATLGLVLSTGAVLAYVGGTSLSPKVVEVLGLCTTLTCLLTAGLLLQSAGRVGTKYLSAEGVNHLMTGVLGLCVITVMGLLTVILAYLVRKGVGALDWDFFTRLPVGPLDEGGGMANGLVGSAAIVGLATVFAVPVGILAAIALAEYRRNALATSVRFIAELLGGVPSIIIGIFAAALFGYLSDLHERMTGYRLNFYGWSGVFALGVMMVPIVMRASEEALKLVPTALRNASFALGGSHAQTVMRVTIPAALPAIITGVFLAIARIAGETAPLLLTAGFNSYWPDSLSDFTPTLPVYIFKYAGSAFPNQQRQAWAAAFVLMAVVLLLNFGIRFVTGKRVVSASRAD